MVVWIAIGLVLLVFAPELFRGARRLRLAVARRKAKRKWSQAKKRLDKFLSEEWDDIRHPQAQESLEKEIAAYEEWIRMYIYCTNKESYLLSLKSLRVRKKTPLRSVR